MLLIIKKDSLRPGYAHCMSLPGTLSMHLTESAVVICNPQELGARVDELGRIRRDVAEGVTEALP
jgi:hypothetical protein